MNKLKYLLSAFVLLGFASCKDDPWEDVADGGWNHERSIIDVKFEGQAGTPTITETDSETGVIELQLGFGHGCGHVEGSGRIADAFL